jgi:hypothetical protein
MATNRKRVVYDGCTLPIARPTYISQTVVAECSLLPYPVLNASIKMAEAIGSSNSYYLPVEQ